MHERMFLMGFRIGNLPSPHRERIYALYLKIAGGPSWSPDAHPLTEPELDQIEAALALVEAPKN